jgi:quercetin dioxygenase-like cupin family protein
MTQQAQIDSVALAERAKLGYELPQGQGEMFWLLGMHQTIKVGTSDTAGQFGMVEIIVPQGLGSPWHVHPDENEWFYVLEGEVTFYVDHTRLALTPGAFAFGPKGIPHTFIGASSEPARALVGLQPVMFEGFLREIGQPVEERILPPPLSQRNDALGRPVNDGRQIAREQLAAISARHGIVILGPPGPPPER